MSNEAVAPLLSNGKIPFDFQVLAARVSVSGRRRLGEAIAPEQLELSEYPLEYARPSY